MKNKTSNKAIALILDNAVFIIIMAVFVALFSNIMIQRAEGKHHPMVFGTGCALVLTGSMEPTITPGSLIVICEKDDYEIGDVITYMNESGMSITHRLVAISGDNYIVQGDANNIADPPIDKSQIVGYMKYPAIKPFVSITVILVIIIAFIIAFIRSPKNNKSEKQK